MIREKEERDACAKVGADITFLGLIDGKVFPDEYSCFKVRDKMKALTPVAVFTSWPVDSHTDHVATSYMARKAFECWGSSDAEFYFLAHALTQTSQFIPDVYIDISDVFDQKLELVRCHKSQNDNHLLVESVIARGLYYAALGKPNKMKYVEGFKTLTPHCAGQKSCLNQF